MPEALRWLWREYPKPIVAREPKQMTQPGWDPRGQVFGVVSADKPWEQVGDTYKSAASPASDKEGNVFFADPVANRIYKSDGQGRRPRSKKIQRRSRAAVGPTAAVCCAAGSQANQIVWTAGDEKIVAQNVGTHLRSPPRARSTSSIPRTRRWGSSMPKGKARGV
jgi:hypothetical protein